MDSDRRVPRHPPHRFRPQKGPSDRAVGRYPFFVEAPSWPAPNDRLKADFPEVERFLRAHAVTDSRLAPGQIRKITHRAKTQDGEAVAQRIGDQLTQTIGLRSSDIAGVLRLSRECAEWLGEGVAFVPGASDFLYPKAGGAKIIMVAEATRDARARAERIAMQGGRTLKELRTTRVGVGQINPLYSAATRWAGNKDTASIEKTFTATITPSLPWRSRPPSGSRLPRPRVPGPAQCTTIDSKPAGIGNPVGAASSAVFTGVLLSG